MLRYVPGMFTQSSYGSDELFFSSRGSNLDATDYDKNGVKLLQDGLPVTTADGNNHNRVIDPLTARYVSVARGANALTYGASTLGGAIDFTSPTARNSAMDGSTLLRHPPLKGQCSRHAVACSQAVATVASGTRSCVSGTPLGPTIRTGTDSWPRQPGARRSSPGWR